MSFFWLGGKNGNTPFPESELTPDMWEDRYFKPGVIHGGEDYLIRVYLNDAHGELPGGADHNQFEVEYISRDLIKEAAAEDPSLGSEFSVLLCAGLESFGLPSTHGDFAEIVKAFPSAVPMTNSELLCWAECEV